MEHKNITLWQHDFNQKISMIITKAHSITRIKKQRKYSELIKVSDSLLKLHGEIKAMGNEIFTELERTKK